MGTRSVLIINDENGKKLVQIYNQWDGYLEGKGKDFFDFIQSGKLVNGFSKTDSPDFNGMGCFAARLIAKFKTEIGGLYIDASIIDWTYIEYVYLIKPVRGEIKLYYKTEKEKPYKEITQETFKNLN